MNMFAIDEILVMLGGLGLIAWVNWYFFVAGRGNAAVASISSSGQDIDVEVEGGYSPATLRVQPGKPIRIHFDRIENSSCSEEVVFPHFGVRRFLPAFEETVVELPATRPGEYEFTCGMGMLRGRLIVEEERANDDNAD